LLRLLSVVCPSSSFFSDARLFGACAAFAVSFVICHFHFIRASSFLFYSLEGTISKLGVAFASVLDKQGAQLWCMVCCEGAQQGQQSWTSSPYKLKLKTQAGDVLESSEPFHRSEDCPSSKQEGKISC
jgi:hypothetical protein